jgi:hypothetical protein
MAARDDFPVPGVRFVNGRVKHRVRRPVDLQWWDRLYAACGATGYAAKHPNRAARDCRACHTAIGQQQAA